MTESDGEIVLCEDFEDTNGSDWEYDEEGVVVSEEANHNTATDPDPATHISEESATSQSVPEDSDDDDNFPLNLLCANNHNTDTVQSEENQNNIG